MGFNRLSILIGSVVKPAKSRQQISAELITFRSFEKGFIPDSVPSRELSENVKLYAK
jgi:hypothetical protein